MFRQLFREFILHSRRFLENQSLQSIYVEFEMLIALLAASFFGHRKVAFMTQFLLVLGILYVLFPIDIIPDFIPILGFADDIFVVRLLVRQINEEIQSFKNWRQQNGDVNVYGPPHRN